MDISFGARGKIPKSTQNHVWRLSCIQLILWSSFFYTLSFLTPVMSADMGWNVENIYYAITICFLVWAVFSPLAGYCVDKGYGWYTSIVSILVGGGIMVAISLSQSAPLTHALIVALGVPMAFTLYDPFFAILMRYIPNREQGTWAVFQMTLVGGLATLATYPTLSALEPIIGWRASLQCIAVIVLWCVLLLRKDFFIPHSKFSDKSAPDTPHVTDEIARIHWVSCILIGISFGFVALAHTVLIFQLPLYLASIGASQLAIILLFILGPAQVIGRLALPILRRYFSINVITIFIFALMGGAITLIWITKGAFLYVFIALVLQGIGNGLCTVLRPIILEQYTVPSVFGRTIGIVAMMGLLCKAFAPAMGAYVLIHLGADVFFVSLVGGEGVAIVLLVVCFWVCTPIKKTP